MIQGKLPHFGLEELPLAENVNYLEEKLFVLKLIQHIFELKPRNILGLEMVEQCLFLRIY